MKTLSNTPQNEYHREMYVWRKAHHICTKCGQEDALKGHTRCISCLEKERGKTKKPLNTEQQYSQRIHQKRRYDLLAAFGMCTACGKRNAAPGRAYCTECLIKRRRKSEEKRRKAGIFPRDSYSGLCTMCNKNPPVEGKKQCRECYEKTLRALAKMNAVNAKKHSEIRQKNFMGGTANEI